MKMGWTITASTSGLSTSRTTRLNRSGPQPPSSRHWDLSTSRGRSQYGFRVISRRSSSRLPARSGPKLDTPVTLPPGCDRLCTSPVASGSATITTIGVVRVISLAVWATGVPRTTRISTPFWSMQLAATNKCLAWKNKSLMGCGATKSGNIAVGSREEPRHARVRLQGEHRCVRAGAGL
jgi:hypothetical protein